YRCSPHAGTNIYNKEEESHVERSNQRTLRFSLLVVPRLTGLRPHGSWIGPAVRYDLAQSQSPGNVRPIFLHHVAKRAPSNSDSKTLEGFSTGALLVRKITVSQPFGHYSAQESRDIDGL